MLQRTQRGLAHDDRRPASRFLTFTNRTSLYIALGAGVYWGGTLLGFARLTSNAGVSVAGWATGSAVGFVVAVFALFAARQLVQRRIQKAFAALTLAAGLTNVATSALAGASPHVPAVLAAVVNGTSGALLMAFWGLNLASLDRKTAECTVLLGASFSGITLFGLLLLPVPWEQVTADILRALTPCLFLFGGYDLPVVQRRLRPHCQASIVSFYASRALLGLLVGFVYCLALYVVPAEDLMPVGIGGSPVGTAICLVASVGMLLHCARHPKLGTPLLSTMPLCMLACLVVSTGTAELWGAGSAVANCTVGTLWFAWIVLSSLQISEFKEKVGVDEATLTFSEKGIVSLFWLLGSLAAYVALQDAAGGFRVSINTLCLGALVIWLIVCAYAFTLLASTKERGRMLDEAIVSARERTAKACAVLARDYGLSVRERDTLELLVLGHTRAYIAEQLGVSTGTVQTHLAHVYQKLGVHKRESVIEMVAHYQERLGTAARYDADGF